METSNVATADRILRFGPAGMLSALAGLGILLALAFSGPAALNHALGSYFFAVIFFTTLTLAFFGLTLLHHTLRATWSTSLMRLFEAGGGGVSLVVMALLFIPIVANLFAGNASIYEWVHPEVLKVDKIIQGKSFWLNTDGYIIRLVGFFVLWRRWRGACAPARCVKTKKVGATSSSDATNYAAPGLVMFFLTVTFALTDWTMSLEPHWYSTLYPLWFIVGQALGALALAVLLVCLNADRAPFKDIVGPALLRDLGNMLFVLTMLWGYTSISQYLILWNGNIPETTQYYILRSQAGWGAAGMALIFGQFVIPFMILLSPRVKADPKRLAKIAGWIQLMRLLDVFYVVVPSFPEAFRPFKGPVPGIMDLAAFLLVGGLWFAIFGYQLRRAALLPQYDHRLQEAKAHEH